MWVFALNDCGWSPVTQGGGLAVAPTPTPVLVAPYGPALSCEYPNGPIFYYWNYPEPDPPYFGIARTNGRDLGVTPLPAPVWNYTHYIRSGSARQFADTDNIQPGMRYDYNVRACHDANCASGGSYANQVFTSCTVIAWRQNMTLTRAHGRRLLARRWSVLLPVGADHHRHGDPLQRFVVWQCGA
ncbi:MAG: hypothetical protein V9H69_18585 [Anaerolineae bacterium]